MKLRIKGIRYNNIREFRDLELSFSANSDPHHISLVQMPNGTGKTTTMSLIRSLLLGRELTEDEVKSYKPDFSAEQGSFEADFKTADEVFTIKLQMDYELGQFEYRHTTPREVGGGEKAGYYLPPELDEVLNESFVDLFVFNGELTEEFLDRGQDHAENALKIVNHLNRLEAEQYRIYDVVKSARSETDTNVTSEAGLSDLEYNLTNARMKLNDLEAAEKQLGEEIRGHETKIEDLKRERKNILSDNEQLLEEDQRLAEEINQIESDIKDKSRELLTKIRHPSLLHESFDNDLNQLLENMTLKKIPAVTSREFFNELSQGDYCICGNEITEVEQQNIQQNASSYLSTEDIGVLNALKDDLRTRSTFESHKDAFSNLEDLKVEHLKRSQERAKLGLDDSNIEDRLSEIANEENTEKSEKEEKEEQLRWLTTTDKAEQEDYGLDWQSNIPLCRQQIKNLKQELNEATGTVEFDKKASKLDDIFDDVLSEILSFLKDEQIKGTNEKLERILGLSKVEIEDIDSSIIVKGRDDTSEGQGLSIAYAYLSTLFEDSSINVPFVIDSPAVSIDYERREYVAQIISELFDQLVIFVISPERERFVDELNSEDIQYLTVHKTDTPGEIERHSSKDFFMEFQSEDHMEVT